MAPTSVMPQQEIIKKPHTYATGSDGKVTYIPSAAEPAEFPKWKYHAHKPPVLVRNQAEENNLGDNWQDMPVVAAQGDWKALARTTLGHELTTFHLEYLQSEGLPIPDLTAAKVFVHEKMNPTQRANFFEDAEKWRVKNKASQPAGGQQGQNQGQKRA